MMNCYRNTLSPRESGLWVRLVFRRKAEDRGSLLSAQKATSLGGGHPIRVGRGQKAAPELPIRNRRDIKAFSVSATAA